MKRTITKKYDQELHHMSFDEYDNRECPDDYDPDNDEIDLLELPSQYNPRETLATFCYIVDFFEELPQEIQKKTWFRMNRWMELAQDALSLIINGTWRHYGGEEYPDDEFEFYEVKGENSFERWTRLRRHFYEIAKTNINYVEII